MKSVTYRWSGDHKTIIDIGSRDSVVAMYLDIAIEQQTGYFKELVQKGTSEMFLHKLKNEIRYMKRLSETVWKAYDEVIDNQKEAAIAAYSLIMPYKED